MKNIFFALLAVGIAVSAHAQQALPSPYIVKSLTDSLVKDVKIITEGGNITIIGGDAGNAKLEVYVKNLTAQMTDSEIERDINANYKLNITDSKGYLDIAVVRKSSDISNNKRLGFSFILHVPNALNTDLATTRGDIDISGLSGAEKLVTTNGNILVMNCAGDIKGSTAGGTIVAHDLKQKIRLSDAGGRILATNCDGDIRIGTSGGDIILNNLTGNINVGTGGANIVCDSVKGKLVATTAGGNISLSHLSCDVSADANEGSLYAGFSSAEKAINLGATQGDLKIVIPKSANLDINLTGKSVSASGLENFKGGKTGEQIKGQLNIGGVPLYGVAAGGRVDLKAI